MLIVCWLTLATVALGLVAVVADPSSSGPFGRLSRRLRVTIPLIILHCIGKTCGHSAQERAAGCFAYVFLQNNPLGQIIYMGLMVGAYTEYLRVGTSLPINLANKQYLRPFVPGPVQRNEAIAVSSKNIPLL